MNNAADTQGSAAAVDEYPLASWRRQFDVNVHAPFVLTGLVVPHLRARGGGVIVNITSSQGDLQAPVDPGGDGPIRLGTLLGYATTKAALNRLGNALAPTLRADNIAVVNLDPGFTRTEHVELLGERELVDADAAAPMSATADALLDILTAKDTLRWSGSILRVQVARRLRRTGSLKSSSRTGSPRTAILLHSARAWTDLSALGDASEPRVDLGLSRGVGEEECRGIRKMAFASSMRVRQGCGPPTFME